MPAQQRRHHQRVEQRRLELLHRRRWRWHLVVEQHRRRRRGGRLLELVVLELVLEQLLFFVVRVVQLDRDVTTFDLEVRAPVVSRFALDGGAMFGVVPRALWSRELEPDDEGRVALVARVLVVSDRRSGDRLLVDTGLGQRWTDTQRTRYAIERGPDLRGALARDGIDPETITHVLVTHFHWDHAGGLFAGDDPEGDELALPRARIFASHGAAWWGERPPPRMRASFRSDDAARLLREGELEIVREGEPAPLPFLENIAIDDAHTFGMLMPVVVESKDMPAVLVPSDVLPTFAHVNTAWASAFDDDPAGVGAARRSIIERACRDRALIHLGHERRVEAATVEEEDDGRAIRHTTFSRTSPAALREKARRDG